MKKLFSVLTAVFALSVLACSGNSAQNTNYSVAVFVPGVVAGSPIYEKLDAGVKMAAAELPKLKTKTIEGGFNQAQWETQVAALAASGEYNLIITSNPALPEICANVAKTFPKQKFLILDGKLAGNPAIATLEYNNRELAYLHGYLAGLIARDSKAAPKLGLIAGQEYPTMNDVIKPGLEEGLKAQNPAGSVEFRVVGNWYDATKGAELTNTLLAAGTTVFVPIAGSANQGVLTAAKAKAGKVLWYDSDGYGMEKDVVAGSGVINQDKAAHVLLKAAVEGKLEFGTAKTVGVKDGYVDYLIDSPAFKALVSPQSQTEFAAVLAKIRSGELNLSAR